MNSESRRDDRANGFTLIELLIVIVILGILATVVVLSIAGIADRGTESTCVTDERTLLTAVESYFGNNNTSAIPSGGVGNDEFELTLVSAGFMRSVSLNWDVLGSGSLSPQNPSC